MNLEFITHQNPITFYNLPRLLSNIQTLNQMSTNHILILMRAELLFLFSIFTTFVVLTSLMYIELDKQVTV